MGSPKNKTWWTDESDPYSYRYSRPDELYGKEYFDSEHHPTRNIAADLYSYMQEVYINARGRYFKKVLEIGSGSGELTLQFDENGLDYNVIEPTFAGVDKLLSKGIDPDRIIQKDIRFMLNGLSAFPAYDLAVCTEVAEHIEPWFAVKVVEACVSNAGFVWWSAAKGTSKPHYHHPNEAPESAWDNIFREFGYKVYYSLDGRYDRADTFYVIQD